MAQYSLAAGQWTATTLPAQIGNKYNVGVSDGTRYYGYVFQPNVQQGGMIESSDVATKDALVNYGSPSLVDRDLVYYPRFSQGDFSGGGRQLIAINPTQYYDADLDISTPGYVTLRPRWNRVTKTGITAGTVFSVVAWQNDFWFSFAEANKQIYNANGGATVTLAILAATMTTDGQYLYYTDGTNIYRRSTGGTETQIASAVNGTLINFWVVQQGTNGYFLYYSSTSGLYKIDLTAGFPVAAGSQPLVPTGSNSISVVDICAYQNGIALLTNDPAGSGFNVWYSDGANLTDIVRVNGYHSTGICACLGDLYVSAYPVGKNTSPVLAKVATGTFAFVSEPGSVLPAANQTCLQPVASGQKVYWPLLAPSITGISTTNYISVYDVVTGAVSHMPIDGTDDFATNTTNFTTGQVAVLGDAVGCVFVSGTSGVCQYQATAFGTITYQSSGWIVSSQIDFATPGIAKRFRRIELHHSPLAAGESIKVNAYVDEDPIAFTTALTPNPSGATVTHSYNAAESSTVASVTALTFGADTVGKTLYLAVQLNAGTSNLTTPKLRYYSAEVGGVWVWNFSFDNTSQRRCLDGSIDAQAVTGKDLDYLYRNAYENGTTLTLYLVNDASAAVVSYSVNLEKRQSRSPSYLNHQVEQSTVRADEEWITQVVLRQIL